MRSEYPTVPQAGDVWTDKPNHLTGDCVVGRCLVQYAGQDYVSVVDCESKQIVMELVEFVKHFVPEREKGTRVTGCAWH